MSKDRVGNQNSIYKTLWASSHAQGERQAEDYYATDPKAVHLLCQLEKFAPNIREPACWEWHVSDVLKWYWYNVLSSDIVDRWYWEVIDFMMDGRVFDGDIVTNPPYSIWKEFVEKALNSINNGSKIAMFLKLQFLEWKARKKLFEKNPPKVVYISSSRLKCAKNWNFVDVGSSAVAYCWYIWEKWYQWETVVKRFN